MNLVKKHFYCNQKFETQEELFKTVAKSLLKDGFVKKGFYKALMTREKKFPTGIESHINIAIPHADPDGVIESTFVVVTLEKPIQFANMVEPDRMMDVSLVIFLVLNDGKDQIAFLQRITDLVGDNGKLKDALASGCKEQFEYFETFFNKV